LSFKHHFSDVNLIFIFVIGEIKIVTSSNEETNIFIILKSELYGKTWHRIIRKESNVSGDDRLVFVIMMNCDVSMTGVNHQWPMHGMLRKVSRIRCTHLKIIFYNT